MIKRTGNAIHIKPINTRTMRNNGSNTMEKMIFVIPQVALSANPNIFPNTTSIMIINNTVNIIVFPLFLQLLFHEILICFLIQVFHCIPSAHLFFQGAHTLWFFVRSSLCIPLCLSCYSHYKIDIWKNKWYLYRNNIVYFAISEIHFLSGRYPV